MAGRGARLLLGLLLSAAPACGPPLGGTPGPDALLCRDSEPDCQAVNQSLEAIRRNIGAERGAPAAMAELELFELEPRLLRYLALALADRDPPVAEAAARALTAIGGLALVQGACAREPRPYCGPAEERARDQARLDHRGRWRGELHTEQREPDGCQVEARTPLQLELLGADGLRGEIQLGQQRLPLLAVKRYGARLDVWFQQGHDQHRLILGLQGTPERPRLRGTWLWRGERHPLAAELAPAVP